MRWQLLPDTRNAALLLLTSVHLQGNVRCMVDAEQTYMQPIMDALTMQLQQTYNRGAPVVFNTYQCYLKSTVQRCLAHFDLVESAWRVRSSFAADGS